MSSLCIEQSGHSALIGSGSQHRGLEKVWGWEKAHILVQKAAESWELQSNQKNWGCDLSGKESHCVQDLYPVSYSEAVWQVQEVPRAAWYLPCMSHRFGCAAWLGSCVLGLCEETGWHNLLGWLIPKARMAQLHPGLLADWCKVCASSVACSEPAVWSKMLPDRPYAVKLERDVVTAWSRSTDFSD